MDTKAANRVIIPTYVRNAAKPDCGHSVRPAIIAPITSPEARADHKFAGLNRASRSKTGSASTTIANRENAIPTSNNSIA